MEKLVKSFVFNLRISKIHHPVTRDSKQNYIWIPLLFHSSLQASCSKDIDWLWTWKIRVKPKRTQNPKSKIESQWNSNWQSNVRGNNQRTTTSTLVTSFDWIGHVFYLAEKLFKCRFRWMWRVQTQWFQLLLLILLAPMMLKVLELSDPYALFWWTLWSYFCRVLIASKLGKWRRMKTYL